MKRIISLAMILGLLFIFSSSAQAITLSFIPSSQDVVLGDPVSVEVAIAELGDFSPPSLGAFDIDISWDSTILSFSSVVYGDPLLGDQLDLFGLGSITSTTPSSGSVNLFELSLDSPFDLDTLQAGSFTLATLTFNTLSLGTTPLGIPIINALGDAWGDPLFAGVEGASINVVPEPSTLLLMGAGLAGIGIMRKRKVLKF